MISLEQLSRVAIVGTSCAGKSTLAQAFASELAAPQIELDMLHWGPNWTPCPEQEFRESVDMATAQPRWVCAGNYRIVRDLVWPRATTLIWLNYSFPVVFRRALGRTLSRCMCGTRVYADNRETFRKAFCGRDSILLWVIQSPWKIQRRFPAEFREPQHAYLNIVRLQSTARTDVFLPEVRQLVHANLR
jgi:adenylate kinase family enzyme